MKETIAKITVLPMILHRLTEIAKQLKRIADLYEGSPEVGDDADPEVYYRDEMRELAEEIAEARKKQMG
jgi:hypothetical protein